MKTAITLSGFLIIFIQSCKKETVLINDTGEVFSFTAVKIDSGIVIGDIYTSPNFAAFTDIANYKGLWYAAFRIGTQHAGGENGQIKVLTSIDGLEWKVMSNIAINKRDLRDPKLTIDSVDNKLYLSFYGINAKHGIADSKNYITSLDDIINTWQPVQQIQFNSSTGDNYIFWRYTYHKGKMYCIAYHVPLGLDSVNNLSLFVSDNDFLSYKLISHLNLTGTSSETTLRFTEKDSMYIVARTETINSPVGTSLPDYKNTVWTNNPLSSILASPNFLFYKNKLLITARDSKEKTFKFFCYDPVLRTVQKVYTFPSGSETGYGGMSFNPHNSNELWITYYSIAGNTSSIKLAKIDLLKFL
jgi:hypothetical protein